MPCVLSIVFPPVFRVNREGKPPLLFSKKDRKPKYVGLSEVNLRKRFHINETIERVVQRVPQFYAEQFAKVMASAANRERRVASLMRAPL